VPHLLNLLNREETVAKVVPAMSKSRPETYAARPSSDEAEQLDFRGGKNTLAATLLHCRGKLGIKHLELATACDAFQESRRQLRVVVYPRPAAHGISGRYYSCIILPPRSQALWVAILPSRRPSLAARPGL